MHPVDFELRRSRNTRKRLYHLASDEVARALVAAGENHASRIASVTRYVKGKELLRDGASAGIAEAGGDAVDGGGDGAVEFGGGRSAGGEGGAFAAEEFDLDERHGVDVGVAQADGALEDLVGFEKRGLAEDGEDHTRGEVEFGLEGGEDAVAQGGVGDEVGVEAGDGEVGFGDAHLDVADDVDEEWEAAGHGLEEGEVGGFLRGSRSEVRGSRFTRLDEVLEGVADAEVGGHDVTGLHPAEDPGDGAEVLHAALALGRSITTGARVGAACGARADARVFEFGDGRGLLEVGEGFRVFGDVFAVEGVAGGGELVERSLPLGEDFA